MAMTMDKDDRPEGIALSSGRPGPGSKRPHDICLCTPELKIPRPRNAFMLYRQHHQASVATQNPSLANPEISKIIGKQWREESQEVKDRWDALAEEEKARHQQQYPNYKYQPRRKANKPGNIPTDSAGSVAIEWCSKCGGRSLTRSGTPSTPSLFNMTTPTLPPLTPSTANSSSYSAAHFSNPSSMHLPKAPLPPAFRRPSYPGLGLGMIQTRDLGEDDVLTPLTPYANKRNRFHPYAMSPADPHRARRPSMQGRMDPPPRPLPPPFPPSNGSVTLPPLQTEQEKGVEAMIMTIPYINKIKVLSKISPALATPGPTSPPHQIRGAIVAVDGEDDELINQICRWLAEELSKDDDITVQIFNPPSIETLSQDELNQDKERCLLHYLQSIARWHKVSENIIHFITSPPTTTTLTSSITAPDQTPATSPPPPASSAPPKLRRPVALIPGYMLTRANQAAARIPINDAYAPIDHWRWTATMWRGIVGPDLTVWIQQCGQEEMVKHGGLEVREDARTLILRKEEGRAFEGKALRRLGFETGEFVRGISRVGEEGGREG